MSIMWRVVVSIILLACASVALPHAQSVPPQLQRAARADPLVFGMMLAQSSLPAGMELRAADATPRGRPDFSVKSDAGITTAALADVFNGSRNDYRAALSDGVLVIRPTGPRALFLDRQSGIGRVEVTGVMNAARKVFAELDPSLAAPGGTIGSAINLDPSERGDDVALVLDGTGRTVIDVLNQIAKQSGKVWFVAESAHPEAPDVVRFGFLHAGGASTAVEVSVARK